MKSKKELKENYKQKILKIGVFQIRNTVNEKIYLGSSVNLDAIWNRNRMELNFNGHRNELLQSEWKQYGEEAFRFEILAEIEQKDGEKTDCNYEVKKLEEMFIEELQPFGEKGYNQQKKYIK